MPLRYLILNGVVYHSETTPYTYKELLTFYQEYGERIAPPPINMSEAQMKAVKKSGLEQSLYRLNDAILAYASEQRERVQTFTEWLADTQGFQEVPHDTVAIGDDEDISYQDDW